MDIRTFECFEDAIEAIVPVDKEFVFVWHRLEPGDLVDLHYHPEAHEWIIIRREGYRIQLANSIVDANPEGNDPILAIHFEPGEKHSLIPTEEIQYIVFRDVADKMMV